MLACRERARPKILTIADYRGDGRLTRDSCRFPRFLAWSVSRWFRPWSVGRPQGWVRAPIVQTGTIRAMMMPGPEKKNLLGL